jgi:hypothetical protein
MIREDEERMPSFGETTRQADNTPSDKMLAIGEPDRSSLWSLAAGAR